MILSAAKNQQVTVGVDKAVRRIGCFLQRQLPSTTVSNNYTQTSLGYLPLDIRRRCWRPLLAMLVVPNPSGSPRTLSAPQRTPGPRPCKANHATRYQCPQRRSTYFKIPHVLKNSMKPPRTCSHA